MSTAQFQNFQAYAAGPNVAPQGVDIGGIVGAVAQHAVQLLPGLLMGLLSAHPQLQGARPGVTPQSFSVNTLLGGFSVSDSKPQLGVAGNGAGVAPQSFSFYTPIGGFSVAENRPQLGSNGAGLAPQGIDFGSILGTIANGAAQALPVLLTGLLSAQPQVQQLQAQGIDFGAIARTVAGAIAPQIPAIANGVLQHFLGNQGTAQ
ncbi:hypothetical protein E7V67_016205 [[Empedobacter] haloabium]|uniref:DUF937 domain-containing protein n=1 Tax=[Empedobacter] haloabium TaxID=592317 RepID=A0ABZ1UFA4_9BURK